MGRWSPGYVRFWKRVNKSGKCWNWTGAISDTGYGSFYDGKRYSTHRWSWESHFGPIPDGLCVLHRCDNRKCVRPDHLWLGTKHDNSRDMAKKGRYRVPAISGERHYLSKLTAEAVRDIRASCEKGIDLASKYGVSPSLISLVRKMKAWSHV